MTDHPKTPLASRILRGVGFAGLGVAGGAIVLGIVLWDADVYSARDRYEHLKLALFGDWSAENWCPPGRISADCAVADDFEAALEAASDFTFFRSEPIEGTDLTVQTGIRFATARDVVGGRPASQWCYVSIPADGISQQIELASKSADEPPIYAALASLDASAATGFGLSVDTLTRLARSHCLFE
jgi:hypothetical protein